MLAEEGNLAGLARTNRELIGKAEAFDCPRRFSLDRQPGDNVAGTRPEGRLLAARNRFTQTQTSWRLGSGGLLRAYFAGAGRSELEKFRMDFHLPSACFLYTVTH